MAFVGDGPDTSGGGPFQANTRIVAIIALTVAGVFVILGLGLSLLRALQQKAAERVSWVFSFVMRHVCLTLAANVSGLIDSEQSSIVIFTSRGFLPDTAALSGLFLCRQMLKTLLI